MGTLGPAKEVGNGVRWKNDGPRRTGEDVARVGQEVLNAEQLSLGDELEAFESEVALLREREVVFGKPDVVRGYELQELLARVDVVMPEKVAKDFGREVGGRRGSGRHGELGGTESLRWLGAQDASRHRKPFVSNPLLTSQLLPSLHSSPPTSLDHNSSILRLHGL